MLGRTVFTNDAGTVHSKDDMQVLHANVVYDLVVGTLQECGVDGNNGTQATHSKPTRERNGMLFRDTDIKVAFREALVHLF